MKTAVRRLITKMQFDIKDPNFKGTPERVEKMWKAFFSQDCTITDFPLVKRSGLIVMRNHQQYGFCPHHLLPVLYTFHFGYKPRGRRAVGASKPLRAFNKALTKLPLQEDIGPLVFDYLKDLEPDGMGVIIKGEHLCMRMRGIQSPCSDMVTSSLKGVFLYAQDVKQEFFTLCNL